MSDFDLDESLVEFLLSVPLEGEPTIDIADLEPVNSDLVQIQQGLDDCYEILADVAGPSGLDLANNQHLCDIPWPVYTISDENDDDNGVAGVNDDKNVGECDTGGSADDCVNASNADSVVDGGIGDNANNGSNVGDGDNGDIGDIGDIGAAVEDGNGDGDSSDTHKNSWCWKENCSCGYHIDISSPEDSLSFVFHGDCLWPTFLQDTPPRCSTPAVEEDMHNDEDSTFNKTIQLGSSPFNSFSTEIFEQNIHPIHDISSGSSVQILERNIDPNAEISFSNSSSVQILESTIEGDDEMTVLDISYNIEYDQIQAAEATIVGETDGVEPIVGDSAVEEPAAEEPVEIQEPIEEDTVEYTVEIPDQPEGNVVEEAVEIHLGSDNTVEGIVFTLHTHFDY